MSGLAIPVVDLGGALGGGSAMRAAAAREFGRAMEEAGFAAISGHGVPEPLVAAMYGDMRTFFAQPMDEKLRWTAPEQAKTRGYLPPGIESVAATLSGRTPPDLCEALVFASLQRELSGACKPNFWPRTPDTLAPNVARYFDAMLTLTRELMRISALALDLQENWFDAMFVEPSLTLRFVNYPDQPRPPDPGQLRYGAHHDYGGLTILRQDDAPGGLQIRDREGSWHDVPPVAGSFVINVGDLMARWTNGRWRSTLHRVINPPRQLAGSTQRLSMVAFTGPHHETLVECLPSCASGPNPARFMPVKAGEYILAKIAASHEPA